MKKNKYLHFRIDEETHYIIRKEAEKNKLNVSKFIRNIILKFIKKD